MSAEEYSYVSSRLVKEVASLGGSVAGLVPARVERLLVERFAARRGEPQHTSPDRAPEPQRRIDDDQPLPPQE